MDNPHKISLRAGSMTPEQCRAARGWLRWSQLELAKQANVSLRAIAAFERGEQRLRPNNLIAIRRAIEAGGVRLVFDKKGAAGILRRDAGTDLSDDPPA
jgi:transcriptional regulator with XRE-family HTH domain